MLQQLNSRIQGWFAWIILSLIAVTFALLGAEHYLQLRGANIAKADVNGHPVSAHAFEQYYKRYERDQNPAEMTAALEKQRKQALLEEMIMKNVAVQAASRNGFYVTNQQVISTIQSIPQFQQEGHFSMNRYQQVLSNAMYTPESFHAEVKEELLLNQQRFSLSGTEYALPSELAQFVQLYQQTRDYDYMTIPYQYFVRDIKVDDKAIQTYYQQHQQAFTTPEEVIIDYVRLSMSDIRKKIQISDEELKRYYDDNQTNFMIPAEWHVAHIFYAFPEHATPEQQAEVAKKADKAFNLLKATPKAFENMVKTQSDDKISAMDAGQLPWIVAGQSEFDKALVELTTVGEISPPAQTTHGYEIFKLLGYKPATLKPFTTVKQDIQNQLMMDRVQTEYSRASDQLSDLAYQTPDSLASIAETLHLTIQQTEPFSRQGGQSELTKNKKFTQTAFSPEVLSQGNNSEPIQIDNDTLLVLRLAKHKAASSKTLAAVKTDIRALLVKQQAEQAAKKLGQFILSLKDKPTQQNKLFGEHHLKWVDVHAATREAKAVPAPINHLAFQMGRPGSWIGNTLENGSFVLIKLKLVHDGELKGLSKEQYASLLKKIEERHGAQDLDVYIKAELAKAKIVRY